MRYSFDSMSERAGLEFQCLVGMDLLMDLERSMDH